MKYKGFTLLEIIIVIIIIGVLASLALPKMFSVVEKARTAEAFSIFQSIRSAMERHYLMNNGSYTGVSIGFHGGDHCPDDWSILNIDNPSCAPNSHFSYSVNGTSFFGDPGFHINAERNSLDRQSISPGDSLIMDFPVAGSIRICGYGYYAAIYGACT